MEHVFHMGLHSFAPHRIDNYGPSPLPDKYAITVDFIPHKTRWDPNPDLDGYTPHYRDIISFCLAVDVPDELGIVHDFSDAMIRKGHKTTDGNGEYCYIIAPQLSWNIMPGQSTDSLLNDAIKQISSLRAVNLAYPDNGERKVIPLSVTNWWVAHGSFPIEDKYKYDARHQA
ncbi:MAG: hypothetical protein ACLR4A_02610 [Christensenellales bacterium]|jgi:hypothetical protein